MGAERTFAKPLVRAMQGGLFGLLVPATVPSPSLQKEDDHEGTWNGGVPWNFNNIRIYPPRAKDGALASAPSLRLQRKARILAIDDPLEREADAQAEAVIGMSTGTAKVSVADASTRVQRKCASCSEEQKCTQCMEDEQGENLARKEASADQLQGGMAAPKAVHDVLRSPGRELGTETREFFERRFRRSFANVRVHTDGAAAASAHEVNALAYTVGKHIVFGAGQYRPTVEDGLLLIAHELTHTIQQGENQHHLQRWAACKPARLSLQECPPREPGENENAKNGPMVFLKLGRSSGEAGGALIANFDIASARIKPSLLGSLYWKEFVRQAVKSRSRLTLVGFTDCQDQDQKNPGTRLSRVEAVYRILPREVQARIFSKEAAPYSECVTSNDTKADRTLNRSVAIQMEESELDLESEDAQTEPLVPEQIPQATTDCTDEERKRLIHAYSVGKAMIQTAMKIVSGMKKGTEEERLLKKYFGKDAFEHRFHIQKGFSDTLREWSRMGPIYDYHCRKKNVGDCEPGPKGEPTLGYVSFWSMYGKLPVAHGDINICGSAFEQNDEDLAITVVHESSHRLDWTVDKIYCPRALGCTLSTERAEDNTDSYAQFAGEAFSRWY